MADEAEVPSPCLRVCVIDAGGDYCSGCHRTLTEIANWTGYTAAERRRLLERIGARRAAAESRN